MTSSAIHSLPDAAALRAHPVLFYDGECGLCDRSVAFLLDRDTAGSLRFAPLQGETAHSLLPPERLRDLDTVVLLDERGEHKESSAMLRAVAHLGGAWRAARALLLVPRPLRDAAYRFIAKRRLALFGGPEACRLHAREERERFLP